MKKILLFLIPLLLNNIIFPQNNFYFVIRVDDIQSRSTTAIPKTIITFQQAVAARGGKVTWAVVPHRLIESQNSDGALVADLKKSIGKGNEISLHGYNHICLKCGSSGHEMVCASQNFHFTLTEQQKLIDDGLKILKDSLNYVPISFVPPAHVADTNTYQSLLDRKIELISTTGDTKKSIFKNLYNLAPNSEFTWNMTSANYQQNLVNALKEIKASAASNGYYCLLLHDPFIREGYENGVVIKWISELLDSLNAFYGQKIKYATLGEAAKLLAAPVNGVAQLSGQMPSGCALMQNYPNPFNPETTIRYFIPSASNVTVTVFNSLGRQVMCPVDGYKNAGMHSIVINGNSLSSGVYYYVMRTGSFMQARKFVLMK